MFRLVYDNRIKIIEPKKKQKKKKKNLSIYNNLNI